jgi:cell division protein FtsQ
MLVTAGLGINEIAVSGHRHTLDQDIFRALGAGSSSLLFFDVGAARQRVEALPWVESASLVRVLPDKLKVEVRERRPAAAWLDGDRVALVDATGRLLAYVATFVPPELPRITGPGAPEAAAELIAALARFPEISARVDVAHRIGLRRWDLELTGGTRVLMAAGPSLASLQRLVELDQETQVLEQANQVVDLTMSRSIAISEPAPADAAGRRAGVRQASARPL